MITTGNKYRIVATIVSLYASCLYSNREEAFKLYCQSRYPEADALYAQAYRHVLPYLDSYTPRSQDEVHDLINWGSCKLGCGDWKIAFKLLEARNRAISDHDNRVAAGASAARKILLKPLPQGITQKDVKDKRILIRAEHGFGDSVTFINWLQPFIEANSHLVIVIQNPLKKVWIEQLQEYAKNITVYSQADEKEDEEKRKCGKEHNHDFTDYDYDFYMMSAPLYTSRDGFHPTQSEHDIPERRLLSVPEQRITKWCNFFKEKAKRPILLCSYASSNPVPGGRELDRNYPQSALAKLCYLQDKSTALYNLMKNKSYYRDNYDALKEAGTLPKDASEDDIIPDDTSITNLNDCDSDFDNGVAFGDTTGCMAATHHLGGLVVSVDTVIPNYGGTLNCKTCLLLNRYPDARWGARKAPGTQSALFDTVYEFRREEDGSYDDVITQVRDFIEKDSASS